jgi:hypothetical protein
MKPPMIRRSVVLPQPLDQLTRLDRQGDVVHRGGGAEAVGDGLELDAVADGTGGRGEHQTCLRIERASGPVDVST